jgi:hypothetical protein
VKRVELFGAPGVGKTVVYGRLCAGHRADSHWVPENEVLTRLRPPPGTTSHLAKWLVNRVARRPQGYLMGPARDQFVAGHRSFVSLCWSLVDEHRGHPSYPVDTRFGAAFHFWNCFARVGNLLACEDRRHAIVDEGLLQRLVSLWSPGMDEKRAADYVALMPAIAAAVVFVADESIVLARVRGRARMSGNHLGMDDARLGQFTREAVLFSSEIKRLLEQRGVPVCTIDASGDAASQAIKLAGFLASLG